MLVSLNWIRDFVDLGDEADVAELAERFTRTTAEVEGVEPVRVGAGGIIAARVKSITEIPDSRNLLLVMLDVGDGKTVETVTGAPVLHQGDTVVYAPDGASVTALGSVGVANVAGRTSIGMILPADSLGMPMAGQEAVFLDDTFTPGQPLPGELFDDCVIEVDNKSLTHRPDLWGHYGIAREIAAILGRPLRPYPVVPIEELHDPARPTIEIKIADADASPRYSALTLEGVRIQPAPLWMQLRLGHVGLRPISGLVDLTNYVMLDLGQPMHAFDAAKVNRIEVDWAQDGERFRSLDGAERTLTAGDLMIQSNGRSVALAGVMGGLETEVSDVTTILLLESANFHPATIRKTARRLGLRTDASARFEKSLDPNHTILGIGRFVLLARNMYPDLKVTSNLSDSYPQPAEPVTVKVKPEHLARTIGHPVPAADVAKILTALGFGVTDHGTELEILVPSFRATGDISIEADIIEEVARFIGYNSIEPDMPRVSVRRFPLNALHELERRTLEYFAFSQGFHEIQGYLWYDAEWLKQLGADPGPCVELQNPPGEKLHQLRRSMMPGMFASVVKNRFYLTAFSLIELGSVFEPHESGDREFRHVALLNAKRGKGTEGQLFDRLKGAIEAWAWHRFGYAAEFVNAQPSPDRPWEHPHRIAAVRIRGKPAGVVSVVNLALRRAMDEHLGAWNIAWAELRLSGLEQLDRAAEALDRIPEYPLVEVDFSLLVPKKTHYDQVVTRLKTFGHPLLKRIRYVGSYESDSLPADRRSLTIRTVLGDDSRTLLDQDTHDFRRDFEQHLTASGFEIRR